MVFAVFVGCLCLWEKGDEFGDVMWAVGQQTRSQSPPRWKREVVAGELVHGLNWSWSLIAATGVFFVSSQDTRI